MVASKRSSTCSKPPRATSTASTRPFIGALTVDGAVAQQVEAEAGAELADVCKIVIYITDRAYREPVYRVIGKWLKGVYPVSTGIIVNGLAKPEYMMEIDIIAEIPPERAPDRITEPLAIAAAIEHFGHRAGIGHCPDRNITQRNAHLDPRTCCIAVTQAGQQSESAVCPRYEVPGG